MTTRASRVVLPLILLVAPNSGPALAAGPEDPLVVEGRVTVHEGRPIAGGMVAFHDYIWYCPDVRRFVNELLAAGDFTFLAQRERLILLQRKGGHGLPDHRTDRAQVGQPGPGR